MARLLHEFPDVFDAYRAAVVARLMEKPDNGEIGFMERREATRSERIERIARR